MEGLRAMQYVLVQATELQARDSQQSDEYREASEADSFLRDLKHEQPILRENVPPLSVWLSLTKLNGSMKVAREITGPVGKERHGEDSHGEDEYVDVDFVAAADVRKVEAPRYSNIINGTR
jgi:hypothetical protein